MMKLNEKGELAVAVCLECDCHSVCDPLWAKWVGDIIDFECHDCIKKTRHVIRIFADILNEKI